MKRIIDIITGKFFRERREQKVVEIQRIERAEREERRKAEEAKQERQVAKSIMSYPIKKMTKEELDKLPYGTEMPVDFLKTCPLGTWFVCKKSRFLMDVTVIGQVVAGKDLLADQWAGLSIPERGINRYRVVIVQT